MPQRPHPAHKFRALSKPKQLTKHDHRHYWPYIPVLLLVISTFFVTLLQPLQQRRVLAYATEMSSAGLLQATNDNRAANGAGSLQINSKLAAAAQAKANDMIARNYWSHNTPDGEEPWVFIESAGYKYQRAGENLAYGFLTSGQTVTGWMNSPSHKANMLDTSFSEVGFGFANGENYNSNGQQTVVVAMYGKPQVLAATEATPPPAPAAAPVSKPTSVAPAPAVQPTPQAIPNPEAVPETEQTAVPTPINTDQPIASEPASQSISRIQALTGGNATWAVFGVGLITGLAVMLILVRHAAGLRHMIRDGERFIMHHPLLDTILVSLVLVGALLSQTTGFIR